MGTSRKYRLRSPLKVNSELAEKRVVINPSVALFALFRSQMPASDVGQMFGKHAH